jgi:prolyl-tRNA synthetase
VFEFCEKLQQDLRAKQVRVLFDKRDLRGGEKNWSHIKKGVPVRVEVGPKDIAKNQVVVARRDKAHNDKQFMAPEELVNQVLDLLDDIQNSLLAKARAFRDQRTQKIDSLSEFEAFFEQDSGFALCHWNEAAMGHEILAKHKVTPRCIPLDAPDEAGVCLFTGLPSHKRVVFAKSY